MTRDLQCHTVFNKWHCSSLVIYSFFFRPVRYIYLKLETGFTDQCFCVDGKAPENDTESTLMHLIIHEQIRMFKFMFPVVLCEVIKMGGK